MAFLIDMFSSSSSSSSPVFHLLFFPLRHIRMKVSTKRSCHIPVLHLAHDTCLLWRMRCVMKASFSLRKLAVDSHLISLPRVDNCSVNPPPPHHTCLYGACTAELTRTPLIWAGREGVALSTKLPSLFFWCHLASNHFSNT